MAKVFIQESTLTSIGDAIRAKTGKTALIDPANMSAEIASIEAGGGGSELPPEAYVIKGDCQGRFKGNGWNWYIEALGNRLTTKDITHVNEMFYINDGLKTIPFDINIASNYWRNSGFYLNSMFYGCNSLTTVPRINFPADMEDYSFTDYSGVEFSSLLCSCSSLRDAENLFDAEKLADYVSRIRLGNEYAFDTQNLFNACHSLRKLPTWYYAIKLSPESMQPVPWYQSYNATFYCCYFLDEVTNIPVKGRADAVWGPEMINSYNGGYCEDLFPQTFNHCNRLKNVTFETKPDGTPYEANWANQNITLNYSCGYGYYGSYFYNSGITAAKRVYNDESYNALKNDPDWYADNYQYSRYNHDSAVATINSLPDTSAFLATVGGTNTISFLGASGANTDGGAINTLTEAEIAVAAAKGWTVTFE